MNGEHVIDDPPQDWGKHLLDAIMKPAIAEYHKRVDPAGRRFIVQLGSPAYKRMKWRIWRLVDVETGRWLEFKLKPDWFQYFEIVGQYVVPMPATND